MEPVDERFLNALAVWLDIKGDAKAQTALKDLLRSDPAAFLVEYINSLPSHLLAPLASHTTPSQRGSISTIRQRRRIYAEVRHPDELELFPSRKRLRRLWKQLVRSNVVVEPTRAQADGDVLDPAFPNTPSDDIPVQFTQAARKRKLGPVYQGELFDHPRLSRLMDEQDQEEEQIRDEEEEEEDEEEEEEDDGEGKKEEDEPGEEDVEAVDAFRAAVLQRFVNGDPTLPASLYARIDFDDGLDAKQTSSSTTAAPGLSRDLNDTSGVQAAREKEQMEEEAYFDEDD